MSPSGRPDPPQVPAATVIPFNRPDRQDGEDGNPGRRGMHRINAQALTISLQPVAQSERVSAERFSSATPPLLELIVANAVVFTGIAIAAHILDGRAQPALALTLLLYVPFLVWSLIAARDRAVDDANAIPVETGHARQYTYRLEETALIQVADDAEQAFPLQGLLSVERYRGGLTVRFSDGVIDIPPGSAPQPEVEAFALAIEHHPLLR